MVEQEIDASTWLAKLSFLTHYNNDIHDSFDMLNLILTSTIFILYILRVFDYVSTKNTPTLFFFVKILRTKKNK